MKNIVNEIIVYNNDSCEAASIACVKSGGQSVTAVVIPKIAGINVSSFLIFCINDLCFKMLKHFEDNFLKANNIIIIAPINCVIAINVVFWKKSDEIDNQLISVANNIYVINLPHKNLIMNVVD